MVSRWPFKLDQTRKSSDIHSICGSEITVSRFPSETDANGGYPETCQTKAFLFQQLRWAIGEKEGGALNLSVSFTIQELMVTRDERFELLLGRHTGESWIRRREESKI